MNEEWTEFSSDVVVAIDTRLTHGHVEPVHERQMVMGFLILLTLCNDTTAVMSWSIPERPDSVVRWRWMDVSSARKTATVLSKERMQKPSQQHTTGPRSMLCCYIV